MQEYLRKSRFPDIFCRGCGHGTLLTAILSAIKVTGIKKEDFLFVSGIGCAGWIPNPHFDMDSMHVTHGRPVPFAVGAKSFNKKLKVIVISGDGDLASIGGNHLIHAARRDIDITVICANNQIYAMTGGQVSPLTPICESTKTTPGGNRDEPFDLCRLVQAAGGRYVARFPVTDRHALVDSLVKAIGTVGFSFVDVVSPCSTDMKSKNPDISQYDIMMGLKNRVVKVGENSDMDNAIPVGEYTDIG